MLRSHKDGRCDTFGRTLNALFTRIPEVGPDDQ